MEDEPCENDQLMQTRTTPETTSWAASAAPIREAIAAPDFSGTPLPIEDVAGRSGFPQCARGLYIEIRGFAGVVVDVVNQSIKVRSPDGITQSFNANRLKTLYAPPERYEPPRQAVEDVQPPADSKTSAPPRVFIADPDYTAPVQPIQLLASQPDFPGCAYGKHVDVAGFTGVVVEIVKDSVKIRPIVGGTRSYNAEVLRKLYGKL